MNFCNGCFFYIYFSIIQSNYSWQAPPWTVSLLLLTTCFTAGVCHRTHAMICLCQVVLNSQPVFLQLDFLLYRIYDVNVSHQGYHFGSWRLNTQSSLYTLHIATVQNNTFQVLLVYGYRSQWSEQLSVVLRELWEVFCFVFRVGRNKRFKNATTKKVQYEIPTVHDYTYYIVRLCYCAKCLYLKVSSV